MDGHFVPNLTIGPPVVKSLRKHTDLFLDCHLMVDNPGVLLDDFADAGADRCIVHVELGDPRPLFDDMRGARRRRRARAQPADPGRRGDAVPRRDRPAARDEREPRLGRPGVHPRGARQGAAAAQGDRRARPRRARSRSTAASTSTPRPTPPRPASTSSSPAARCSGPTIPSPRRARILAAAEAGLEPMSPPPEVNVHLVAKVLVVSDGVHEGTREDHAGPKVVAAAQRRGLDGRRAPGHRRRHRRGRVRSARPGRRLHRGRAHDRRHRVRPRDLTPEGTRIVIDREAPGPGRGDAPRQRHAGQAVRHARRAACAAPSAPRSCATCPGSSNGALECLEVILPALPHALDLLSGGRPH